MQLILNSFYFYFALFLLLGHINRIYSDHTYQTMIKLSEKGIDFILADSFEVALNIANIESLVLCAKQCNQNVLCRSFVYDRTTLICRLYQSDSSSGNLTSNPGTMTQVGFLEYQPKFYENYNKTCDFCRNNRYLTCMNGQCQCPSLTTYWDGKICQNKLFYGKTCNLSTSCREDRNLSCFLGTCQAICKLGATAIIFDDIPNKDIHQGIIPSTYNNLSWTSANYLNSTRFLGTGYDFVHGSGEYVSWFNTPMTIQSINLTSTFTLDSFMTAAGWSNSITLTVIGYLASTELYRTSVAIDTHTKRTLILNWSGINKVIFNPSGSGFYDTGIDNLCITF